MSRHEYILPGEEASFVVHRTRRKMGSLRVHFTSEGREVLGLKRAIPELHDVSIVELADRIRSLSMDLGPYGASEADERAARLQREGLRVSLTNFVEQDDLLVDERGPVAHLIEDESENRRIIEDAVRRGVRIVEHDVA